MRRQRLPSWALLLLPLAALHAAGGACLAGSGGGVHHQVVGGAGGDIGFGGQGGENPLLDGGTSDPHAVLGASPPHGPFTGGDRVLVTGKGFGADVRVFFGDVEVDPATRVLVDDTRVQVTAPPGAAGAVDLSTQNGDDASTLRTLAGAYTYDAFFLSPNEGPVSGGTRVDVIGQGTAWDATTKIYVDLKECGDLEITTPELASCTVPAGTQGVKTVRAVTGGETILVADAYTYADSDNGYKGGLSGDPLAGKLRVLVYDNFTGDAVPATNVIVGSDLATALVGITDATGVVELEDPSLVGGVTVTAAGYCHSPTTFVGVPVDTVTFYLDPVLSPACGMGGDPPPVGGKSQYQGLVSGELVWDGAQEFQKGVWNNVPGPVGPNEKRAAYVFATTGNPDTPFSLPAASNAVTELSPGDLGYGFSIALTAGNRTLYALAGVEDRSVSPPKFTAYVMGMVQGVPVEPQGTTSQVFIPMRKTIDQVLHVTASPPPPGAKGPDRLRGQVVVQLPNGGYAILPNLQKTTLLPFDGTLSFGAVPSLDAELAGSSYVSYARAATGPTLLAPLSVVGKIVSNSTAYDVVFDGFVGMPGLTEPAANAAWDGQHLSLGFGPGAPVDLTVFELLSGNGLFHWTVAVPGPAADVTLPDLSWVDMGCLPPGPVTAGVYGASIAGFSYDKLRYRNLRPQGMTSYSYDTFPTFLAP